jgi:protein-disulfide isomerase
MWPSGWACRAGRCNKETIMSWPARFILAASLVLVAPLAARADEGFYPIKADDGEVIANHRVPNTLESEIEKLPGVIIAGNPRGDITLNEFYDVNCPYCRQASADIDALIRSNHELRLVLVPFPVLGIPSIQGTRIELAVARLTSAQTFYRFHRMLDETRGVVDGSRAMAAVEAVGLDPAKVLKIANEDSLADVMTAHLHLGDALAIAATPGFVIKGVAIVGYPGPKSLARIIDSVKRCDAVICEDKR